MVSLIHSVHFTDEEKEPEYRDVVIKKDCSVKDFYDIEDRLGT